MLQDMNDLLRDYRTHIETSRLGLRQRAGDLTVEIEQAFVDGVISEEQRASLMRQTNDISHESVLYFPRTLAELGQIAGELNEARHNRTVALTTRWHQL